MNEFETKCDYNLAKACVDSITVAELSDLCGQSHDSVSELRSFLKRYRAITRANLQLLSAWVDNEAHINWIKPLSGTTALLTYSTDMPSREFCVALLQDTGVMLTPGSALDMEGYARIGFANNTDVLKVGLQRLSGFLQKKHNQISSDLP